MSGSEYEKVRAQNIARNNKFLTELGLGKPKVEPSSPRNKVPKKRKRREAQFDESSLRRSSRSTRSSGPPEEFKVLQDDDGEMEDGSEYEYDEGETRKKVTAKALREIIEGKSKADSQAISNQAIVHCIDRLNSMSVKALGSRIRTISKAAGKNSREKLLVFQYALKEAGLDGLSEEARAALKKKRLEEVNDVQS